MRSRGLRTVPGARRAGRLLTAWPPVVHGACQAQRSLKSNVPRRLEPDAANSATSIPRGDGDSQIVESTDSQILKSTNSQILKSSNQILKSSNPQILKFSNFQMPSGIWVLA